MTAEDKRRHYQAFFTKNEAGQEFMNKLQELIEANHDKSEKEPDNARDYSQRAKGIREVKEHIQSLTAERRS